MITERETSASIEVTLITNNLKATFNSLLRANFNVVMKTAVKL